MSNLYGRLMIDIEGLSLSEEDIFVLSNKNVGGLILFSRNYESIEQLQNLISEINDIKKTSLYLLIKRVDVYKDFMRTLQQYHLCKA